MSYIPSNSHTYPPSRDASGFLLSGPPNGSGFLAAAGPENGSFFLLVSGLLDRDDDLEGKIISFLTDFFTTWLLHRKLTGLGTLQNS